MNTKEQAKLVKEIGALGAEEKALVVEAVDALSEVRAEIDA